MSANGTDVEPAVDCEGPKTFHIYTLSFVYSLLAALIIVHLLFRWHWRRRKLSRFRSSQPGDKTFKNKRMRERLRRDFAFIQNLSPNPRLVNKDHAPQEFGECADGSDVPVHWYRMMAFDAAADFVSAHTSSVHSSTSSHPHPSTPSHHHTVTTLPEFIHSLNELPPNHNTLLETLTGLYNDARFNNGEFGKEKLELFQESLKQLKEILNHNDGAVALTPSSLPSPTHHRGTVLYHQSTWSYSSQDPLLRVPEVAAVTLQEAAETSSLEKSHQKHVPTKPDSKVSSSQQPQHRTPTSLGSGKKKRWSGSSKLKPSGPSDSELSPLVGTQLSPASLPRSPVKATALDEVLFTSEEKERSTSKTWQRLKSTETQV